MPYFRFINADIIQVLGFFVSLASAFIFFIQIGVSYRQTIPALIMGWLIAAPVAAKLADRLLRRMTCMLLGMLVVFRSVRILTEYFNGSLLIR